MEFLASIWFRYLIFPLGTVLVQIAVKYATVNDRYENFKKEDVAVGLELILTGVLMYVVLTTDRALDLLTKNDSLSTMLQGSQIDPALASQLQNEVAELSGKIASSGWLVLGFIAWLWFISTVVRKLGWRDVDDMHPVWGIAIPLVSGVIVLILVMVEAAR